MFFLVIGGWCVAVALNFPSDAHILLTNRPNYIICNFQVHRPLVCWCRELRICTARCRHSILAQTRLFRHLLCLNALWLAWVGGKPNTKFGRLHSAVNSISNVARHEYANAISMCLHRRKPYYRTSDPFTLFIHFGCHVQNAFGQPMCHTWNSTWTSRLVGLTLNGKLSAGSLVAEKCSIMPVGCERLNGRTKDPSLRAFALQHRTSLTKIFILGSESDRRSSS